ncbi:MAG TPA: hypothetical protein PLH72_16660 [Vicinamibacterales bacterium]|nr:hypothetical protein [Vicinamibacterales bacterium]
MAITNRLVTPLDRKTWEFMTPAPVTTAAAMHIIYGDTVRRIAMLIASATAQYLYYIDQDAWEQIATVTLGGTMTAGACGDWSPLGPSGTATAGSTTSMTTNLTIPRSLAGYTIRITAGTGAGQEAVITRNKTGANAVFTFAALGTGLDNTSVYVILSGRYYVWDAGTMSATSFQYYDFATNTWTARSVTSAPATWATDGRLVILKGVTIVTGTATAGGASTLTNGAKTWTANQWTNFQIRITAGTGAGQTRTIASNTDTVITTSAAWTINPDATSVYAIETNQDHAYLMGNNAVTLYRYSISGNSWSTLAPGAARAAAPGLAASLSIIESQTHYDWTNESAIINGRRLYSFRGGAGAVLDYYDIAANTWVSGVAYGGSQETFTTGTQFADLGGYLYILKEATGRCFRYSPSDNELIPWSTLLYTQGAALLGNRMFGLTYTDTATLRWVYVMRHTGTELFRCMVI